MAFTSEFRRGRLEDLVALLSGRNFETRQYEESIVEDSFTRLGRGVTQFINETQFKRFLMIIRSAGFVAPSLIGSQNALNFAYVLYLTLRTKGMDPGLIETYVRRWFVMSLLTGRYSGSAESQFDTDIRRIEEDGIEAFAERVFLGELSDGFWEHSLIQALNTSVGSSPAFRVFKAAQVKLGDKGLLSRDISVRELVEIRSDIHHIFPKDYLKKAGFGRGQYNQVANYAVTQSEINIRIGNQEPARYFSQIQDQVAGGERVFGNITSREELTENFRMNCIPDGMEAMTSPDYPMFLEARRKLMAERIRSYFATL